MRRKSSALARTGLVLAVTAASLPLGLSPVEAAPAPLPHAVGGYIPGSGRTQATVRGGLGAHSADNLPASVDLRANAPAVGDQGQIGACVAWTLGYSIMGYWAKQSGGTGAPYAPLYMYMTNVARGGAPTTGLSADYVLPNTQANGIDTQNDYWQGYYNYKAAPTVAETADAKNYKVTGWTRLFNGANQGSAAQTVIEQALASGSPVALGIPVYRDFMALRGDKLYTTVGAATVGLHMVAIYGYDADGVIIRNSWGTGWGNHGDAHLSWAFITKAAFGAYTIDGVTSPSSPVPLAPAVASLSVARGSAGSTVTITGSALAGASSVRFGDAEAAYTAQAVDGSTKLVATVPAGVLGVVNVTVTNASGTSAVAATTKYTVIPPPPGITGLSTSSQTIFGGTPVTLTGTHLTGVTAVKVGTVIVPAKSVTATSLTFTPPAHAPGPVAVTVTNAYGTSSTPGQLTYVNPPAPVVTSLSATTGPTYKVTPVTITGTDLTGATRLTADGVTVPFSRVSGTQLKATMPVHAAGDVTLRVVTPGGTSDGTSFSYVAPPVPAVATVTPSSGLNYLSTTVMLNGSGFTDATKATANGVTVSFVRVSDTQVKVTLAPRAAGEVALVVTTPGGPSVAASYTALTPPAPAVTGVSPSGGTAGRGVVVQVTGSGFTGTTRVTLGGASASFVVVSDTALRVTLPAKPAGSYDLVVVGRGGTSPATSFAYA